MTNGIATVLTDAPIDAPARSNDPWSGPGRKHFALTVIAGLTLGGLQGVGQVLRYDGTWWVMLGASVMAVIANALLLLLALTAAARIKESRMPRWLPYAVAAVVATVLSVIVDWSIVHGLDVLARQHQALRIRSYVGVVSYDQQHGWMIASQFLAEKALLAAFAAFGVLQAVGAARRTGALRGVQLERVRAARETYEARLATLQARVEPSFLFDTLSDVQALYKRDASIGAGVLDDLIVYLRAALPSAEESSSTVQAEFAIVRAWLEVMRHRSRDRLSFAVPDLESSLDARMPAMLLLPVVQQAVAGAPDGALLVSAAIVGNRLRITVSGPAAAFAPSAASPMAEAIRGRLVALYGGDATLVLQGAEHERSQAVLEIPYEPTHSRTR